VLVALVGGLLLLKSSLSAPPPVAARAASRAATVFDSVLDEVAAPGSVNLYTTLPWGVCVTLATVSRCFTRPTAAAAAALPGPPAVLPSAVLPAESLVRGRL
jgi:hypothetical protein